MRRIHKISSVCKYCHCSAAVMMVHMHAEFVGPLGRHGRHLQKVKPRLHIVLCIYNAQGNREATTCDMRSIIRFLNARNMKPAEIHHQLREVYGEHTMMRDSAVQRWVRHFSEGCENVCDDPRSGRPSVVNEDLVRAAEEKTQENRHFTISSLYLHFTKISCHFFMKFCLINFIFGNCVHTGCRRFLRKLRKITK
jgi:hypothetical protein